MVLGYFWDSRGDVFLDSLTQCPVHLCAFIFILLPEPLPAWASVPLTEWSGLLAVQEPVSLLR